MNLELAAATVAGLAGGIAMVSLQLAAERLGRPGFDVMRMWAAFLGLEGQPVIGLVVHLAVSVAIAVLYGLGFALAAGSDAGWAWGLVGAVVHWIIGGLFLAAVPPDEARNTPSPGPFGMRLGHPAPLMFLAGHVVFGVIVGVVYFGLHSAGGIGAAI